MANETTVRLVITADGSGAVTGLRMVGDGVDNLKSRSQSSFDRLKSNWLAVTGVVYASIRAVEKAWAMAEAAAKVEEQMASLDALAAKYGTTSRRIVEEISRVSGGLIGTSAATEVAAQSLSKNLKPDQIYQLAEAAETLSNVTGKTAADSFRELSAAVALGRERAMEGSAGAIDLRNAHGELASMVSESTRRQWMFVEVVKKANELKKQGVGADDSAADKLERFGNVVAGASRQVGGFLLTGIIPLTQGMTFAIEVAQRHSDAIKALAIVAGVYAVSQFLACSAAVGRIAFAVQNASSVIQYFATATLGPMLVNPITWLIVALGGLAYLWIKLGKSTQEAKVSLDNYLASVQAMSQGTAQDELKKQEEYIRKLSAWIDDRKQRLTDSPGTAFGDAGSAKELDEQIRNQAAAQAKADALKKRLAAPGANDQGDGGYSEQLKRIEDLERDYRARKEQADAAESEREKFQLNAWYDEQVVALKKLDAPQKAYTAAFQSYSAQWDKIERDRLRESEDRQRGYLARKEEADAGELDREIVRLNNWVAEQKRALDRAGASDQEYKALWETYSVEMGNARLDRAVKIAEIELQTWEKNRQDLLALEKARNEAGLSQRERFIQQEAEMAQKAVSAGILTESEGIRRRRDGERQLLEIQQERVFLKYDESMSEAQFLVLLEERAKIQMEIEESKRMEAYELDLRRLELEREITDLSRQQAELLQQQHMGRLQKALGKIGGGEFGASAGEFNALSEGAEAGVAQGKDQYSLDYQAWAALQDEKIMKMEEQGAAEAAIRDAYRQYDLQQEQAAQQQKIAMTSAGLGIMSNVMQAFYAASGNRNKAFFQLYKGFAIAQATMDTYAAFNAALKGPPGPPWSYAIAAATLAMGLAKVSQIASMQPGGSASASGGGGGFGGSVALPAASAAAAPAPVAESKPSPIINVHVYGNVFGDPVQIGRELAPHVVQAWDDGVRPAPAGYQQ